ncbi:MAG: DUF2723 domain-containing protein [Siphonobacter sp.]
MKNFQRINNLLGWIVFAIAFFTYASTVEETASFWDCGEFIACSFKLQVPHPPGAPIFLLLGRMFSLLAGSDLTRVAYWINMMSVLASALTILFMFWTLTMLGRKIINKNIQDFTLGEAIGVFGSGVVGSLIYTYSDTFWFSAVEAEVYAMSSFFTALVFWAMFRWELIEDESAANRWIILIAYLTGLSIGIHLLNLVTLPALALIYYFKKYPKPTLWGGIASLIVGVVILGIINAGVIPGIPGMAFTIEKLFVNAFGLPYYSGVIFFVILFFGAVIYGVWYAQKKQKPLLSTALLSLSFILIGYLSYTQALVRANFNPPINENNPSDAINFLSYLKREQYGSRSLTYGPLFTARVTDIKKGDAMYKMEDGKYKIYDNKPEYVWEKDQQMLFPRLWSQLPGHPQLYGSILNLSKDPSDPSRYVKPTFGQNISYMFSRQMGFMYMRYFMWNFVGRESDYEWADWARPGKTNLPETITTNKGHDNFYFLPLILGILGFFLQFFRRDKDWLVVAISFIMTGLALVVFLNSPPTEPRERDYIYVGSFYFFALWCGLGVMALQEVLGRVLKNPVATGVIATLATIGVPVMMGSKSWDNHDRSNRWHSVDFAKNLLNSCAPNAILFTGGDNDTFPLWYVQEVEHFRTDVRVCNLSLLGTDWYIEQMKRATYESQPLPISLEMDNFRTGINDQIPFSENPNVKDGIDLQEYIQLVKQNNPAIQIQTTLGQMNVLPSSVFSLKVDQEAVKGMNIVAPEFASLMTDRMTWSYGQSDITKPELIQLDIIAHNNFRRPVYFSSTLGSQSFLGLKEFMQLEGYAYRLMPFKVPGARDGFVNSDLMYNKMMMKMAWREMNNPEVYYDETYRGAPVVSARIAFYRLATQLIQEGKLDKAKAVLNHALDVIPDKSIPYDQISVSYIGPLLSVGEKTKALQMADLIMKRANENLNYYIESNGDSQDIRMNLYEMNLVVQQLRDAKLEAEATKYEQIFNRQYQRLGNRLDDGSAE